MEDEDVPARDESFSAEAKRLGRRFWTYVETRSLEHWLVFAAGVIIGLLLG